MATVPAITDGNTYTDKTASVSTPPGLEDEYVRSVDLNAIKARLAEHATGINTSDGEISAAQADATQALADAAAAQTTATNALTPTLTQEATSRALADADLGTVISADSAAGVRAYTLPDTLTVPTGKTASITIIRDGANDVTITPSGSMVLSGLPVSGGSVTIGVDGGVVTILLRTATDAFVMGAIA